jgi:hypothetical protein
MLLVVRPWLRQAFAVWDYGEMLPLLRASRGFGGAFGALAEFYRRDGRANYLTYAQIAATWRLAGADPLGWQLQRALLMVAAGLLFVWAGRRLGATPLAAALGAALFLLAVPSTEGWLFLMGEPLAVILLLLMAGAAAGYRTTPAWRSRALLIALLAALVMLTKEILGVCLPMVVLLAVSWDPAAGFRRPAAGPRERWLALLLLAVVALEGWSVVSALHAAAPRGYATAYGQGGLDAGTVWTLFQAMALPDRFTSAGLGTTLFPANLAFLLILLLGFAVPAHPARPARTRLCWGAGLLAYPLVGALAYALWPRYSAFYGIPFFAGSAGLLVAAASAAERGHRRGGWVVAGLGAVAIGFTALVSWRTIGIKNAIAGVALDVTRELARRPRLDSLYVVTPSQGGRRWPVTGGELRRYGIAVGFPDSVLPAMVDAPCERVARRLNAPLGRSGVLNDINPCGRLPLRTIEVRRTVSHLDWLSGRVVADSVVVEILAPLWPKGP